MTGQRRPEGPPDGQWAAERLLSGSWAEVFFMPSQDVAPYDFRDPPPGSRVPAQIWIEDGKLKSARWYYPTQDHGDHRQMPTIHHFHRDQRLPRPGELLKRFEAIKTENDVLRFATVWGPLGMCMCEPTGQPAGHPPKESRPAGSHISTPP